ncbi:MAG TPA: hypothetical protein VM431_01310 [Phycisphaerae bacterium]|nr:hypothetical protein [Phycisphaerae bacterium]
MQKAIQAGDIVRTQWPASIRDHINLYLGSGRCGASLDAYGLMNAHYRGRFAESPTRTTLMHADHWHRGDWGLDYWLPVARLVWADAPPAPPPEYRQHLTLSDGRLVTEMTWPGLALTVTNTFHPGRRDLLAVEVGYEASAPGAMPDLLLVPETDLKTHYDQHVTGTAEGLELDAAGGAWRCRVRMGTANSVVALRVVSAAGKATLEAAADGLRIRFAGPRGRHLLVIGVAGVSRQAELQAEMAAATDADRFAAEAAEAWRRRWGDACIEVPVPEYQALWARSLFWVLASYAPDSRSPAPPHGWSGVGWPFHFPQDVSYIHPALLRLGHLDVARAWVDFYRRDLETMQSYTRDIYEAEGTMWAWEYPIGPDSRLLRHGTPNWCQFEIHNAAYPARMAREASQYARDEGWTREVAWPVVRESARFFGSIVHRETDGTWGIAIEPSFGQDEMGGENARNYLCALYGAAYSLRTALAMAEEVGEDEPALAQWRRILADGLAFGRLWDEAEGVLMTCEGQVGTGQFGKEKHPVQLNPLIFLPLGEADAHVRRAYERRYDLCSRAHEPFFHGWTGAAFWLAASHLGDAAGLTHDLAQARPARYVDPAWTTIYETSTAIQAPFYVTSHGLALQALNDALVSDYWGETRIGAACPAEWGEVRFTGLRTADGRVHSGRKTDAGWQVTSENGPSGAAGRS